MKIKVAKRSWQTAKMNNDWQKLANYFSKHYPMDKQMAKYFREAMKSTDNAAWKLKASSAKAKPKHKKTSKKRTTPKRRTTAKRWSAPKRRTMKRRAA